MYCECLLSVNGPETIRPCVASPENDNPFPSGNDLPRRIHREAGHPPILLTQKLHRKMNTFQVTARYGKFARCFGSAAKQNGMKGIAQ